MKPLKGMRNVPRNPISKVDDRLDESYSKRMSRRTRFRSF